ncbi:MAG: cyclic-phosphate processing receiver domain-containing protein [Desulfurobacteriaceae bacterium]
MKIYLDDTRTPPPGYTLVRSVNELKEIVKRYGKDIEVLDLDNYMGEFYHLGGNGIDFVKWLEEAVILGEVELNPNVKITSHSSDSFAAREIEEIGKSIKAILRSRR